MTQDATAVAPRRPPSPGDYIRPSSISAAPESVVMSGLREHAPAVAGFVDRGRRELRPVPGPNPITALSGLLGLDEPLGMIEGPVTAAAPLARPGERVAAAAVRWGGLKKPYTGMVHPDAWEVAAEATGVPYPVLSRGGEEGFVTNLGQWLSRSEAKEWAERLKQTKMSTEEWAARVEELKRQGVRGVEADWLDSENLRR
jgi:hypothetical protein